MSVNAPVRQWLSRYLRRTEPTPRLEWGCELRIASHELLASARERFLAAGYQPRHFFPHRIHYLPKCGPDGFKLAERMCGVRDAAQHWQVSIFAVPPATDEFPRDLFFDPDLVWHQQHFGQPGQVATADAVVSGDVLFTMAHQSDLVQRISRRREHKTRVERVFEGWHRLIVNALVNFASLRGLRTVRVPSSTLAMEHTDRARRVQPPLFERVYDRAVHHHFLATRAGRWWSIDLAENRDRIVCPARMERALTPGRTICVVHDIEQGLGHRDVEPAFAAQVEAAGAGWLDEMLDIERRVGVCATYNVVGCLMAAVRERIEADGHCLGFHSYDHSGGAQLHRCREVDYRVKGYRAPRSQLTAELTGDDVLRHNFEWLASSSTSLGSAMPVLDRRLVRIPIAADDFPMHARGVPFAQWAASTLDAVRAHEFAAVSLHDCYAPHWLPHYREFLEQLSALGTLQTLDGVSATLFLSAGI